MEGNELNKKILNATVWSSITEILSKIIPPIINIILARLLTPEMFGIVASFTVIVSFSDVFTDAGFQKYIIQHEFSDEKEFDENVNVAFWTNFILSVLIWIVIIMFVKQLASMIGVQGYEFGVIIACIAIPTSSFSSIQNAVFKRKFDYKSIFWIRLIISIMPLVITVPLVLVLRNYWALVLGNLLRQIMDSILLTIVSPWKPHFFYSFRKLKEMMSFCIWTLLEQISIWLGTNLDIFFIGVVLNFYYLGLYKTTLSTVNSIFAIISSATTPVLFAGLSRVQNKKEEFNSLFYKFQKLVAVLVLPLGFGCFVFRDLLTYVLLGEKWKEASFFIGAWSLMLSISIIFSYYNSEIFRSKGKPKLSLIVQCVQIVVLISTLFLAKSYGYEAICLAKIVTSFSLIIASNIVVKKWFNISPLKVIINCMPMLICSIVMALVGFITLQWFKGWMQIISVLICIIVYFVIVLLFPSIRKDIKNLPVIKKILARL